jgi:diamine N-acetyltransferase
MTRHEPLRIGALAQADIDAVRELAHSVWHRHYPSIISTAQIDYMLAQRYAHEVIAQELRSSGVWWHKATSGARLVGFSACALSERSDELKLDKLYVHNDTQRRGVGGRLVDNAARLAAHVGKTWLVLAVNKNNAQAIGAYLKHGFAVCESVVKDIGQGFVMDDFIMVRHVDREAENARRGK